MAPQIRITLTIIWSLTRPASPVLQVDTFTLPSQFAPPTSTLVSYLLPVYSPTQWVIKAYFVHNSTVPSTPAKVGGAQRGMPLDLWIKITMATNPLPQMKRTRLYRVITNERRRRSLFASSDFYQSVEPSSLLDLLSSTKKEFHIAQEILCRISGGTCFTWSMNIGHKISNNV